MVRVLPFLALFALMALYVAWFNSKGRARKRLCSGLRRHLVPIVTVLLLWVLAMGFIYTHQGGIKVL